MTGTTRRGFLTAMASAPLLGGKPDAPAVLSLEPLPTKVRLCHIRTGSDWVSTLSRDWAPGDGERCSLCAVDRCTLDESGNCLRSFVGYIRPDQAPRFRDPALDQEGGAR